VHFRRGPSVPRSNYQFRCGDNDIETIDKYNYLGLTFTEFMDFSEMAKAVAKAASRALGLVIAKYKAHGRIPFRVFTQLYDALVQPIINYGASVCGHHEFSCISAVQHRASRFYLGLGKYAPNTAITGEMGWKVPSHRRWLAISRQWCRLCTMGRERINW
jgi:hypothetical protein